jgi:hypothetical protein
MMIPVGYMAKHVINRPDWLKTGQVADIYSVSHHMSNDFADYINFWKHNGYWLFNSPEIILEAAKENSVDLRNARLFYYEAYEFEYDDKKRSWEAFSPASSFQTDIVAPGTKRLEGYDIVTFSVHTNPQCSPLSCNGLAAEIETNEHCLLSSFEKAKQLLDEEKIKHCEEGPYRIFAVYSVPWR